MSEQRRQLKSTGILITGSVQRLYEALSLNAGDVFAPGRVYFQLDSQATASIFVADCDAVGAKPSDITGANGVEVTPGGNTPFPFDTGTYPPVDVRLLCFKGSSADTSRYVNISYWVVQNAVNPT